MPLRFSIFVEPAVNDHNASFEKMLLEHKSEHHQVSLTSTFLRLGSTSWQSSKKLCNFYKKVLVFLRQNKNVLAMTKLTITGKSMTKRRTLTKVIVSINTLYMEGKPIAVMYM
jgi:hypothetical protein